jgi:hypothetical protein
LGQVALFAAGRGNCGNGACILSSCWLPHMIPLWLH